MSKSIRIQRKRTKGWRMPENSVIVDRTSKWGNPFKKFGDMIYCDASHRRKILDPWIFYSGPHPESDINRRLRLLFSLWVGGYGFENKVKPCPFTIEQIQKELNGKNLICFCSLDEPCHAEVLLVLANPEKEVS